MIAAPPPDFGHGHNPYPIERFCEVRELKWIRVGDRWIRIIVNERGHWRDGRCVPDDRGGWGDHGGR